jgi:predicted nucleotide-binding protein (sugar kinase/HSP70/actin superfamily)
MGSYSIPIERVLATLFPDAEILPPPPHSAETLETGSLHSPESVCAPFKYNMGGYIHALNRGANVLVQTGLGCIFAYYGEAQERILRGLGYDFHMLCLSRGGFKMAYETYKTLGGRRSPRILASAVLTAAASARAMDRFEYRMRESIGFEQTPGQHEALHRQLLEELGTAPLHTLLSIQRRYERELNRIPLNLPEKPLRVGIIGELFTAMEPFANCGLERELAKEGIWVSRKMNASFLLSPRGGASLRGAKGYLTRHPGATGADSVAQAIDYARKGYNGIIHMKSFGCTPELNAIPALAAVSRDFGIPVLYLSFDTHTAEAGLHTRLEAFVDMLRMRGAGRMETIKPVST